MRFPCPILISLTVRFALLRFHAHFFLEISLTARSTLLGLSKDLF